MWNALRCGLLLTTLLYPVAISVAAEVDPTLQARAEVLLRPGAQQSFEQKLDHQRDAFIAAYAKANQGKRAQVAAFFDNEVAPCLRTRWEMWFRAAAGRFAAKVGPTGISGYEQFLATDTGQHYRDLGQGGALSDRMKRALLSELGLSGTMQMMRARKAQEEAMRSAGLLGDEGE
jgi:hypothetical protein